MYVFVCVLDTTVIQSHMGRRISVGMATDRTSWFTPPHRKRNGRAIIALPIQLPLERFRSQNPG